MKTFGNDASEEYLKVIKDIFKKYKESGDKTFAQLDDRDFHFKPDPGSNSIAVIVRHLSGNMKSRFTDFLTSDGEKSDRNRDSEFEDSNMSKFEIIDMWEDGWKVFWNAFKEIKEEDLLKKVTIRNEPHSVIEALNRQAAHYAYHVGQIVMLAKMIKKEEWKTLSIPKGKSNDFNKSMLSKKS